MSAPHPGLAQAWAFAQQAIAAGNMDEAQQHLRFVIDHDRRNTMAAILMAGTVLAGGRMQQASRVLLDAVPHAPADPALLCRLAQSLLRVGEIVAVRELMAHPALAACSDGTVLATLAQAEQTIGRHAQSLVLMDRAAQAGLDAPEFRYYRAVQLQFNGKLDEAALELEKCLQRNPHMGRAQLTLSRLRRQSEHANHLDFIREQLASIAQRSEDHAAFEFAQYKELEDLGDDAQAWAALRRGNDIMAARTRHDPARESDLIDQLIDICDARFLQAEKVAEAGSAPIFIVGLPRSGTTLLETILGRHSQVMSCGELGDFPRQLRWQADCQGTALLDERLLDRLPHLDYSVLGQRYRQQTQWRADDRAYYIDKLPPNYLLAGLIAKALPRARILHLRRDAMDVCFSNYRALFGEAYAYSYELGWLAEHYRQYARIMGHWRDTAPDRVFDISYQALVTDPERITRAILAHCGLPFEAACLDDRHRSTPVATLSSAQVREPIDARGLGLWRRYESGLAPLLGALGR